MDKDGRISLTLNKELASYIMKIVEKYGMSQNAAIRFLLLEGVESLKEQGRL